jgi:NDP-sugar pyrophosphorylase family protein
MTMPPLALLAGGLATRLHPLTEHQPKSMVTVAGEPFIAHQLRWMASQQVDRVVACVGHLGDTIRRFVGDGSAFGLDVRYSDDGPVPLGTGGALRRALPLLGDRFLVMYGDSYLPVAIDPVVERFRSAGRRGLMTVFRNDGRWDNSNVEFEAGHIRAYDKVARTARMRHIDYGLGLLRAEALAGWPDGVAIDLAEVYARLLSEGQLEGFEVTERFYEIGSPDGLAETDAYLRGLRP